MGNYFSLQKPTKSLNFLVHTGALWLAINFFSILLFACIYYYYDNEPESIFKGMHHESHRTFNDYLYFSTIINTTLGLGEIIPNNEGNVNDPNFQRKRSLSRKLVCFHVMFSLFINDMMDSFENLKLA